MKNFKMIALSTVVALTGTLLSFAHASPSTPPSPGLIGDCWVESGMDIADGQFSVRLDTKVISKAKLLTILNALNGRNIEPLGYPLIFGTEVFVYVQAVDHGLPAMTRNDLKSAVMAELTDVVSMNKGISAACNPISYPAPAVGVRQ